MRGTSTTVLVVDDQPAIADGHAARLEADYTVLTAYDGTTALEQLDETVDVVLLDRRMPGLQGEEVLEHIREQGYDCRVAMLSGVEPRFDIIDMGFDDYLTKPVSRDDLLAVVERLERRVRYDRRLQEYFALASKAATLEIQHEADTLEGSEEYTELRADLERLREDLDDALAALPPQERYSTATRLSPPGDRASN